MSDSVVTLTEEVPEYRTLAPTKTTFSYPKDPEDEAWYAVSYGEPISSLDTKEVTGPAEEDVPLAITNTAVTADKQAVALLLVGGTADSVYSIRLGVTTIGGDKLFRTVRIAVADK